MNSRKVKVTVIYDDKEKKLNYSSMEIIMGSFSFHIELSCMIGIVKGLSTFDGGYLSYENKKYTLVGGFNGLIFSEDFSEEENAIILAEIKQIVKCAKEDKEYSPVTKGLEYYVEYPKYLLDLP